MKIMIGQARINETRPSSNESIRYAKKRSPKPAGLLPMPGLTVGMENPGGGPPYPCCWGI
ncbi:hypothetical protein Asi02nite_66130 [Asanoa siamensis]|uniref:Uncharacterized protein n=1 Tax=Asanoa siamensis TaxID=926357 RepID=A0ABQ4D0Q0_9ACTN|nr:hypothetical protein Asi02nite_66130 [Asanoa siamensis]